MTRARHPLPTTADWVLELRLNTGGGDSWSTNGTAFIIPTNGIYQIRFSLNTAKSTHTFAWISPTRRIPSCPAAWIRAISKYDSTGGKFHHHLER